MFFVRSWGGSRSPYRLPGVQVISSPPKSRWAPFPGTSFSTFPKYLLSSPGGGSVPPSPRGWFEMLQDWGSEVSPKRTTVGHYSRFPSTTLKIEFDLLALPTGARRAANCSRAGREPIRITHILDN